MYSFIELKSHLQSLATDKSQNAYGSEQGIKYLRNNNVLCLFFTVYKNMASPDCVPSQINNVSRTTRVLINYDLELFITFWGARL